MLFGTEAPCMSNKVRESLAYIENCFTPPKGTFIKVFGAYKSSHLMPLFVNDKVVMQEVVYQLSTRLSGSL